MKETEDNTQEGGEVDLRKIELTRQQGEFKEVLVTVNRTTKVVKGGRRFSFASVIVCGDGNGRVGYGLGKAKEVAESRAQASRMARAAMVYVPLKDGGRTIFHDVFGKSGSGSVILRSAKPGSGIIAGGAMRAVFETLGVADVVAKSLGSSNVHNMIAATFDALRKLTTPKNVMEKRNIRAN